MAETATLLADFALRYLFAAHPQAMGKVLGIVYRTIASHLIHKTGNQLKEASTGAVTLIQRFGSWVFEDLQTTARAFDSAGRAGLRVNVGIKGFALRIKTNGLWMAA